MNPSLFDKICTIQKDIRTVPHSELCPKWMLDDLNLCLQNGWVADEPACINQYKLNLLKCPLKQEKQEGPHKTF